MLDALNCLARTSRPTASVAHLVQEDNSLRHFKFLRALTPTMTVDEFARRVASAFVLWPKALLEAELNQDVLASSVQRNLFDGNAEGWQVYVTHVQKTVAWFGTGLPEMSADALANTARNAAKDVAPIKEPVVATLSARPDASVEKKGWPWPEPRSTS
ncbi:hypothetical protein [Paraburkholderia caffeinilytica]|uniref:hypothetical protein n=1 Tax=Paraburkholderia caffeinilytica TaxID=1761016 RepID=UPI0038B7210C